MAYRPLTQDDLQNMFQTTTPAVPPAPAPNPTDYQLGTTAEQGVSEGVPPTDQVIAALHDVTDKLTKWAKGIGPGSKEAAKETSIYNQQAQPYIGEEYVTGQNNESPQVQAQRELASKANIDFTNETLKPAAYTVGLVNPAVAAPFVLADAAQLSKPTSLSSEGGEKHYQAGGAGNVVREFSGANFVDRINQDPNAYAARLNAEPITTLSEGMGAFLLGRELVKGGYKGVVKASDVIKDTAERGASAVGDVLDSTQPIGAPQGMNESDYRAFKPNTTPGQFDLVTRELDQRTPEQLALEDKWNNYADRSAKGQFDMVRNANGDLIPTYGLPVEPPAGLREEPAQQSIDTLKAENSDILQRIANDTNLKMSDREALQQKFNANQIQINNQLLDDVVKKKNPTQEIFQGKQNSYINLAHDAAEKGDYTQASIYANMAGNRPWEQTYQNMAKQEPIRPPKPNAIPNENIQGMAQPVPAITPPSSSMASPVAKQTIIDTIRQSFGPLRSGRTLKGLLGQFDSRQEVMRSADYGDLPVITHELGHFLDNKLVDKTGKKLLSDPAFDSELLPAGEPNSKPGATPDYVRGEGVAEFVREYTHDIEQAKTDFPQFYDHFQRIMDANPEIKASVETVRGLVNDWYNQNPYDRGIGTMKFNTEKQGLISKAWDVATSPSKWTETAKQAKENLYANIFDKNNVLNNLQKAVEAKTQSSMVGNADLATKLRLARDSVAARAALLQDGKGDIATTFKKIYPGLNAEGLKSLGDIQRSLGLKNIQEYKQFSSYVNAIHQRDIMAENMKTAMDAGTIQSIINAAPQKFVEAQKEIVRIHDYLRGVMVDSGRWDVGTAIAMKKKWPNYVPEFRDFDEAAVQPPKSIDKRMKGSTRTVIDPLQSTADRIQQVFRVADQNKVRQAFVEIAKHPGLGDLIEKVEGESASKDSVLNVFNKGVKESYAVPPDVYKAITYMNEPVSNIVFNFMRPFANVLRAGAVLFNVPFIMRHISRDMFGAAVYGQKVIPGYDTAVGIFHLLKNDQLAKEFKASGAANSMISGLDREYSKFLSSNVLEKTGGQKVVTALNPMTYLNAVHTLVDAALQAPKVMQFKRMTEKGMDYQRAAVLAKDITIDPSRGGYWTKQLNQIVPFLNVGFQGLDLITRNLRDRPGATIFRGVTAITLPTLLCWQLNHDDPRYKDLPQWEKDLSWIIPTDRFLVRIPKPLGIGFLFGSLPERIMNWAYNKDPHSFKDFSIPHSIIPPAITPLMEMWANKSLMTGKPIVPDREMKLPPADRFGPNTSTLAKGISSGLAKAAGSQNSISPLYIDEAVRGYTGGLGDATMKRLTLASSAIGLTKDIQPSKQGFELPLAREFTITPYQNSQAVQDFYDKFKEQDQLNNEYKQTKKKPEGFNQNTYDKLKEAEKTLAEIHKDERAIVSDEKMSPDAKRQKLDKLNQQAVKTAQRALVAGAK